MPKNLRGRQSRCHIWDGWICRDCYYLCCNESSSLGVPKVLVSTVASGDTKPYVGTKDIVMIPSIVDVAGVNAISVDIYSRAVGALTGMMETEVPEIESKPLIAASMFGNTTKLIEQCKEIMEVENYEVMVFHATGTGGMTMGGLDRKRLFHRSFRFDNDRTGR